MKKAVSLNDILTGNTKRPKNNEVSSHVVPEEIDLVQSSDVDDSLIEETPAMSTSKESIGEFPQILKPKILPIGERASNASIKSFLMQRKPPKDAPDKDQVVISLEDDIKVNDIEEIIETSEEQFNKVTNPIKLTDPQNFKKTKLKNLFDNFKKPVTTNALTGEESTNVENSIGSANTPLERFSEVSKLKQLDAPLPTVQLIQPTGFEYSKETAAIPLKGKIESIHNFEFLPQDYKALNVSDTENKRERKEFSYSIKHSGSTSLWPELFKPKTASEVMLEPSLKKSLQRWIDDAFSRLKRLTTRKKLFSTQQEADKDFIEFDGFIIPDDMTEEEAAMEQSGSYEDFVPVMILHGDGVGKNTLLSTIMKERGGQILEINSTQNRSKKELLDKMLEYCTSHYVKDKSTEGIILFDDVDILFKEHDKGFWMMVENVLMKSRKPVIITCRDINFIPTSLTEICEQEGSCFHAKKVATKTVVAFLEKYCKTLDLQLEQPVLQRIVESNNKDIRKCLIELQFWLSSGSRITLPYVGAGTTRNDLICERVPEYLKYLELMSHSDIMGSHTYNRSQFNQDADVTLMTSVAKEKLNTLVEDSVRLANDFILDYRLHLTDDLHDFLLPFEVNIASHLVSQLQEHCSELNHRGYTSTKYHRMIQRSVRFLRSRITNHYNSKSFRKTRNSRRIREILDNFRGNTDSAATADDEDNTVEFDFATTARDHIAEEVNPYVLHLANYDLEAKRFNKQSFSEYVSTLCEEDHFGAAKEMVDNGMFRSVWFQGNPEGVINSWK
ncbi:Elg1p KNAG_0B03970 [Huiozyma naganishii CBS 8797]|uniref:ATPase AAA-type core domain-containing protein n=1 Tax=Huiozyma naganishii (strain ATCC MYA-139 / BCRC 22969 / CBS 8797 / KCTC 17520 / NBRC 10181 / NCYC 3082 / Yp74L-3) TaxID=1071383 RepID=J7RVA0_HUIN7|nr:hypothetical protein KNAG_0B03970 [Kazachstania naganishii CBS 8797]CCK68837.1 hypothetical protein KNAG_0B03970 [Kazachstania naganishii CBS 8797]